MIQQTYSCIAGKLKQQDLESSNHLNHIQPQSALSSTVKKVAHSYIHIQSKKISGNCGKNSHHIQQHAILYHGIIISSNKLIEKSS